MPCGSRRLADRFPGTGGIGSFAYPRLAACAFCAQNRNDRSGASVMLA
jgi:hypothetical protein